jgi:hypothetical protein
MRPDYIKLNRQLRAHWLWNGERFSKGQAWVDLLLLASHADHEAPMGNSLIPVKRGQVLTSQTRLAAKWLWTRKSVNAFLTMLKRDNQVDIRTSKETETGFTLITIKNYEKFQGTANRGGNHSEPIGGHIGEPIRGTSEGHPRDTINKGEEGKEEKNLACDPAHAGSEPSGRRPPKAADPNVKSLIDHYHTSFVARFGIAPAINGGKDGQAAKRLLSGRTLDDARWVVTEYLRNAPDWQEAQNRYNFTDIAQAANTLLVRRAKLTRGE